MCPINRAPKGQTLYDTIAFVIFLILNFSDNNQKYN